MDERMKEIENNISRIMNTLNNIFLAIKGIQLEILNIQIDQSQMEEELLKRAKSNILHFPVKPTVH